MRTKRGNALRVRGLALVAVAVLVSLAACSKNSDDNGVATANNGTTAATPSASASLDARDAQLRYAQCMRENGVNVPDPDPGQPVRITSNNGSMDMNKLQEAQRKCQSILQAGGVNPTGNDAQAQDAMVKFAQCMRQHGINVPDPKPGEGLKLQAPGGSEAQAQAAQKACQQYLPGAAQGGPSQ